MPTLLSTLDNSEYAPFYKGYLESIDDAPIVELMINDLEQQIQVLESIPEEKYSYRYQEGKWSIAEMILHLCDSEDVFMYRALTFARNDSTDLPGFDHDNWVVESNAEKVSKKDLIGLYKTTRNHNIALFKTFSEKQLLRKGSANSFTLSVRALGYISIGHSRHHFKILQSRYLI